MGGIPLRDAPDGVQPGTPKLKRPTPKPTKVARRNKGRRKRKR